MRKAFKIVHWLSAAAFIFLAFVNPLIHPSHSHYAVADFGAIGALACRTLQARLVDYFGRNISLYRIGGSTAFIKWLLSPQNTRNFQRINMESIPGKKRGVAFKVDLPFCFSLCALNVDCATENIVFQDTARKEIVFDLTNPAYRHCDASGNPVRLRFKESDLAQYCTETDQSYMTDKIAQYLLEWEMALDKVLVTLVSTKIGTDTNCNAINNLPFFVNGTNTTPNVPIMNPAARWYLEQLYTDIGLEGQFGFIGGTIVSKIAEYQKWTSANMAGVDLSKYDSGNPIPFYDRNFNTTFGASDIVTFAPGTAQLVTWNKYRGEKNRAITNLFSHGTVVLPTTGLEVDWKFWYDYECEEFLFEASLFAELAVVPAGGCGTNDATVNGILRIHECGDAPLIPVC